MTTDRAGVEKRKREEEEKNRERSSGGFKKRENGAKTALARKEGKKSPRKSEKVMGTLKKNERKFRNVERGKDVGGNYKKASTTMGGPIREIQQILMVKHTKL